MIPKTASSLSHVTTASVDFPSSSASLVIWVPSNIIETIDNSVREGLLKFSHELFIWVLISALAVVVGVFLEGPEILHEMWPSLFNWLTWTSKERLHKFERLIKRIGLIGWLLVVIGVAGEGVFEALQNRAEGQLQTFNDILLTDATLRAGDAQVSSVGAAKAAHEAETASGKAADISNEAKVSAANALTLAKDAREEIKSAKLAAADANSRLAVALREVAQHEQELKNIRSDRSLFDLSGLNNALALFRGTEYMFKVSDNDTEAIRFTRTLDKVLHSAGWIRKQPGVLRLTPPSINVFSDDPKDAVEVCIADGIQIHTSFESFRAANNLNGVLERRISPSNARNVGLVDKPLSEGPILVCVGKKP